MSEQHPAPGPDEIILVAPAAGQVRSSREHQHAGRPAQVVVTLGQMGTPDQHRQAPLDGNLGPLLPPVPAVLAGHPPRRGQPPPRPGHP